MVNRQSRTLLQLGQDAGVVSWMLAAFGSALAVAAATLATAGTGERGTSIALQLTGRLSLLLFWPAYAGSALAVLFGSRFAIFARRGRDFGLAYAAAQSVHISLVAHIIAISGPLSLNSVMPFFMLGVLWTYLLALSSIEWFNQLFTHEFWWSVRNIGLEYIALLFMTDLVFTPIRENFRHPLAYLPFSILIIIGPFLRIAGMLKRAGWLQPGRAVPAASRLSRHKV